MLIEVPEKKLLKKIVVKRDGKKVEFDGAKIALAIQKVLEILWEMKILKQLNIMKQM